MTTTTTNITIALIPHSNPDKYRVKSGGHNLGRVDLKEGQFLVLTHDGKWGGTHESKEAAARELLGGFDFEASAKRKVELAQAAGRVRRSIMRAPRGFGGTQRCYDDMMTSYENRYDQ
jgi:hypothetical protein